MTEFHVSALLVVLTLPLLIWCLLWVLGRVGYQAKYTELP